MSIHPPRSQPGPSQTTPLIFLWCFEYELSSLLAREPSADACFPRRYISTPGDEGESRAEDPDRGDPNRAVLKLTARLGSWRA